MVGLRIFTNQHASPRESFMLYFRDLRIYLFPQFIRFRKGGILQGLLQDFIKTRDHGLCALRTCDGDLALARMLLIDNNAFETKDPLGAGDRIAETLVRLGPCAELAGLL